MRTLVPHVRRRSHAYTSGPTLPTPGGSSPEKARMPVCGGCRQCGKRASPPAAHAGRSSRLPQPIEQPARGKTIRHLPDRDLEVADRRTRARTEKSVRLADIEAAARQELLQL